MMNSSKYINVLKLFKIIYFVKLSFKIYLHLEIIFQLIFEMMIPINALILSLKNILHF